MAADPHEKVNILLVDDHPAKLMAYEVILQDLGENLIKATSGKDALEQLLRNEVAVVLVDVCMPDLDGFQLAQMIREHPRFQNTAMIFISAIHLSDVDRLRGYAMGAVDYVPVPVIPEVLRAKVKVFAELFRKTRLLEHLNAELETRVAARTAELEASTARLLDTEQRRSLALKAGSMGSWEWDGATGQLIWDDGQYRICGVEPKSFVVTPDSAKSLIHPDDCERLLAASAPVLSLGRPFQSDFRVRRPNGDIRWCVGTAIATVDDAGRTLRITGVTVDITERKHAEERQLLLAQEVDHRAKNALDVGAVDSPSDPSERYQRVRRGGGRPDQGAVACAHDPVAFALAGCRSRWAHRRGVRAIHLRRLGTGCGRRTQSISRSQYSASFSPGIA